MAHTCHPSQLENHCWQSSYWGTFLIQRDAALSSLRGWTMQRWLLVNSPLSVALLRSLSLLAQAVLYFLLATLNGSSLPFQDCNEKVTQLHLHCSCLWLVVGGVAVAVAEAAFLSMRKVACLDCDFQFAQEWLELEPVFKLTKSTVPCHFLHTRTLFLSVWTTSLWSQSAAFYFIWTSSETVNFR